MFTFEGYYSVAYAFGLIAFIWLISFGIYQRREIVIDFQDFSHLEIQERCVNLDLNAFIKSRHPEGLSMLSVFLTEGLEVKTSSDIPDSISNIPQLIDAKFHLKREEFEGILQDKNTTIPFVLCAKLQNGNALFVGFPLETKLPQGKTYEYIKLEGVKMKGKISKEKDGIDKKQLYRLLEKASQSFKKL